MSSAIRQKGTSWWKRTFPAVAWLASYELSWLRLDIVAGVTLAAYLLPAALGDALSSQFASENRPLRLLVRRIGFLDLLRFALYRRFSDFRHFACHWLVACRNDWR